VHGRLLELLAAAADTAWRCGGIWKSSARNRC